MRKDIEIPEIEGVYLAIVKEFNEVYRCEDWYAYLINDNETYTISHNSSGKKELFQNISAQVML